MTLFGTPPAWHALAKCRGADVNLFFPGPNDGGRHIQVRAKYCAHCEVVEQCEAQGANERWGIWGLNRHKQRPHRV